MLSVPKEELQGHFTMLPMDEVYFGSGSLTNLSTELDKHDVRRAVIVTGNTLAEETDLVDRVIAATGNKCAGVFHETVQHVPRRSVIAAAAFARAKEADAVISVGGGTPNDTAKAVTICLAEGITEPAGLDTYMIRFTYPDKVEIPSLSSDPIPMFAIPTTLSAGEFTYFVGVTDEARKVKDLYVDRRITAKAVFLDPDLTMATPEQLWLGTGIGHQLGARCNVPHGETSAVMMQHVMAFNRPATVTKQAWVAEAMGIDITNLSEEEAAIAAKDEVAKLVREDMGLPWQLRDVGVTEDDFDGIAADALEDIIVAGNPRQVTSKDEVIDLLRKAW